MKKFLVLALMTLALSIAALGQSYPRPYISGGINLMPPGYASTAESFGGGVQWNLSHLVFDSYAGYDNGKKTNDGTPGNIKGHDRYLRGFAAYKQGNNYVGVGARWAALSTANYSKGGDAFAAGSWYPEVGVGRDWSTSTSKLFMRTQVAYMFRETKEVTRYPDGTVCDGCGNGSQGADISVWLPSPARPGHFFARFNVVLFSFHDTITAPDNIPLTLKQTSNHHLGESTEFTIGARF